MPKADHRSTWSSLFAGCVLVLIVSTFSVVNVSFNRPQLVGEYHPHL